MCRIVTFGEIMLRLSPPGFLRFKQTGSFNAVYGGGEANVAVSLANYGEDVAYVTKLPKNALGESAVASLRQRGVSIDDIVWGGSRLGIYFLEKGASQRPSKVVYDRTNSSIAEATAMDFDWDAVFKDAEWFHFTGITPALGENVADICEEACIAAKKKNIKISCDLNYRKNLWDTKTAGKTMRRLMTYVDICIANEEDAEKVFGIKADDVNIQDAKLSIKGYENVARKLSKEFEFEMVAITLRESLSASDNRWSAMLFDNNEYYLSKKYDIHIVDRVGGGDSFAAGLIYGLRHYESKKDALEFAVAASCLKHSIEGDFNEVSVSEVEMLANGDASGRVQR